MVLNGGRSGISIKTRVMSLILGKDSAGSVPLSCLIFDMVIVVTGWNILPDKPFLHAEEAIERVVLSVIE
jgi:hypothetical protein